MLVIYFIQIILFMANRRDFIENDLVEFAKQNPGVVVYLQPRRHRKPKLSAEYRKCYTSFYQFVSYINIGLFE